MAKAMAFGSALARIRRESGFDSAHAFYKVRDGRRNFQMTFRNYLNVEQGKSLPKPERVEALLTALRVEEHSPAARELADAYFVSLGLGALLKFTRPPRAAAASSGDGANVLERAGQQVMRHLTSNLTMEQWKAAVSDYAVYVCDDLLQTTSGGLTLPE